MKFLTFPRVNISLAKKTQPEPPKSSASSAAIKTRASYAVKPPPVRTISYEIGDIKAGVTMATHTDRPDRSKLLAIYDYIMQDAHLNSQVMIAVNKVISEPFSLYRGETPDKEATRLLQGAWFEQLVGWIIETEFYGFSLVEFDPDPAAKKIDTLLIWRTCVQPDQKLLLLDGSIHGATIPYGDIAQELNLVQFGRPNDLGALQKAAYNVLWKYYARSDWSRASEKFGMPVLHIKANTNVESELDRIEQKAASFGTDGYIVTQAGDEVEIKERSGQDIHKIYLENIRYCDEQISKLVNGQTATSDEKAWTGSANVQERVLEDISYARMRRVKYAVNNQVIPFLVAKGFTFLNGLEFDYLVIKDPKSNQGPQPPEPVEPPEPPEPPAKKKLRRQVDSDFFHSALHNLYFGAHDADCECHRHHTRAYELTLSRKTVIYTAVNRIMADGYEEDVNSDLFNLYFNDYQKAINQVYPAGVNPDLARKFRLNAAQFAAHKTYQVTSLVRNAGADKKTALDLVTKHNRYHQAETTTITARARSARQWERFESEKHLFPNLTWIRTRSASPRELHLGYAGITLPMNHPFWQNNQPGNLWNCKCDWKTSDAAVSPVPGKIVPPAKGLEGNPFETGELVTQKHPYFKNAPERIYKNALLQLPDELAYFEVNTEYGSYWEHVLVKDAMETENNRKIVRILLKGGVRDIKLLPTIYHSEKSLRERYYGQLFSKQERFKCPDAKLGSGLLLEFKECNFNKASKRMKEASGKSDIVVISIIDKIMSKENIRQFVQGQFFAKDRILKQLIIINNGEIYIFNKTSTVN